VSIRGPRVAALVGLALVAALAAENLPRTGPDPSASTQPAPSATPAGREDVALVPAYSLPRPDRIHDMAERPLFVAGRRPPEPLPGPKKATQPRPMHAKQPEFVLSAIVREGNRWIAVIGSRDRGAPPAAEVEVGGVVAGWRVERITAEDVVLQRGKRRATVSLRSYPDPVPGSRKTAVSKTGKRGRPGG
jgi:hypothetical protein